MKARRRLVYGLLMALLFFAAAEGALRTAGFRYQRGMSYMRFNFPNPNELHNVFLPDAELLWKMRPGFDFGEGFEPLNGRGFRGPMPDEGAGGFRVACIGDSVTFGGTDATYPALLEEELERRLGRPVTVYNFGVPGYSSWQGRKLLPRVLEEYQPHAVVVLFGWNDHWLARGHTDREQTLEKPPDQGADNPLRELRVYQAINRLVAAAQSEAAEKPAVSRVPPGQFEENLRAMVELCGETVICVLATKPSAIGAAAPPDFLTHLGFIDKEEDLPRLHQRYNRLVRRTAEDADAALADLASVFENHDTEVLFNEPGEDPIHPNAMGYELAASRAADAIIAAMGEGVSPGPEDD